MCIRDRVLEVMKKEINKHTSIGIKYTPYKEGRSVVGINFEIWDSKSRKKETLVTGPLAFEALSFAQVKAYDKLVAYGVADGIALEMMSKVKGSEIQGFEDWYFESVIQIFESKTVQEDGTAKAGTLVIWFLKKKVFDQGDMFARIMEALAARKKQLQKEQPTSWENRMLAKDISAEAFRQKLQV